MSLSQPSVGLSIDCAGLSVETVEAFQSAATFIRERMEQRDQGPRAFAQLEEGLMDQAFAICRSALRGCIEARDDGGKRVRHDDRTYYRSLPTNKTICTLFGRVTYTRPRYRTASRGSSFVPVDESLGLFDSYLTVPASYRAVLMLDHCTSRDAAALFEKLGGMNPSASQLHRLGEVAGRLWKEGGDMAMDAIRRAERIPAAAVSFAVSLDGVMVPIRPHEDGREDTSWREASCGTISFHDADGIRLDTLYFARMPEAGKVTLKQQLDDEVAHIRKVRPDLRLAAVADAAADNWTYPRGAQARRARCRRLPRLRTSRRRRRPRRRRRLLREIPNDPDARRQRRRQARPRHPSSSRQGRRRPTRTSTGNARSSGRTGIACVMPPCRPMATPIGSGVVEAANKVLVNQRMKRAGMRWSIEGGQNILTFRALIRSGRFERAWQTMVGTCAENDNTEITKLAA